MDQSCSTRQTKKKRRVRTDRAPGRSHRARLLWLEPLSSRCFSHCPFLGNNLLDTCEQGEQYIPACLDDPGRLWSLWDIMNHFRAGDLAFRAAKFAVYERTFKTAAVGSLVAANNVTLKNFLDQLAKAAKDFRGSSVDTQNRPSIDT